MGGSDSVSQQKEINETNISTTTNISGGIGVTGQQAVDLVAVTGAIASNLASTSTDFLKNQSDNATKTTQAQLSAASSSSAALAQVGSQITKAVGQLTSSQDDNKPILILASIAVAGVVAAAFFLRN